MSERESREDIFNEMVVKHWNKTLRISWGILGDIQKPANNAGQLAVVQRTSRGD